MPYWSAIAAVGGQLIGGFMGNSGQSSANRANLQIWREQRDWMTKMSNSEMQRRVSDLRLAGLNPMLAMGSVGSASTPTTGMPKMENTKASSAAAAMNSAMILSQMKVNSAQAANLEANARRTDVDTAIAAEQVPHAKDNAYWSSVGIAQAAQKAQAEVRSANTAADAAKVQLEVLQPLEVRLQKAVAKGEELGIAEKQALADLYENVKGMKGVEKLLPLILTLIRDRR